MEGQNKKQTVERNLDQDYFDPWTCSGYIRGRNVLQRLKVPTFTLVDLCRQGVLTPRDDKGKWIVPGGKGNHCTYCDMRWGPCPYYGACIITDEGRKWIVKRYFLDTWYRETDVKAYERIQKDDLPLTKKVSRVKSPNDNDKEKPLHTREKKTLLVMLGALCTKLGIDPMDPAATSEMETLLELQATPLDRKTIRSKLREIPEAVEDRQK